MPLHLYALINACWFFFAECPKFIGKGDAVVKIKSDNQMYGTKGSFSCESGSDLFYDNGTERLSNITFCNSDASWSGQHHLECWKGLNVIFVIVPRTQFVYIHQNLINYIISNGSFKKWNNFCFQTYE